MLEFLQERLTAGAAATTLRVYVAAIAARRELDEIPLGRHRLVSAFMRGARRLRPVRPTAVPSWDLSVVLEGLVTAPFEPLESASDRILTLKVVLLLALTSLKRVGDLQAFSVSETCMDFAPGLVKVTLRPRPGYIPKVLSTSFRSQVVTLHSFHPPPFASSEDERLHMLCPVRALKLYVDRSKVWRKSPQLLICFGASRRGLATSKQRISHWVRDAISLAYEARELPSPLCLRVHSTRGVASWRIFVLRQDGPLRTLLSGFTTLTLIRLQVLRSCLFEPTVCCWFIIGPDRQRFQLGVFGITFPKRFNAVLSYLWKRTSRVTRVTLVLWIGNETLRLLPSSSRCRQGSFRQRNLRSGWRVRQYDLTTSLRQRRRRAISQWIGVILYGLRLGHAEGVPEAFQRSVSFPIQRTRVTRVTRDVFFTCSEAHVTLPVILASAISLTRA